MKRLKRPALLVPLLSALPVLSLLMLGTAPAQATFAPRAAPRFIAIDLGTLGGPNSVPNDLPQAIGASPAAAFAPPDPALAAAPVGTGPAFAAENYRTHTLYVPDSEDGTVSVVNLATCSSLNVSGCARQSPVIRVGNLPLGLAVDQATNTVYVANAKDNTVSIINGATCDASDTSGCGQRPATVAVGAFGNAVAVDPVTNTVFVTNQAARPGTVSVIDGNSCNGSHPQGCAHQPLATVTVGGGPSGIAVNRSPAPCTWPTPARPPTTSRCLTATPSR
jgi:YVTN family beta-propeller protein